jgi:site-specific recombinase XerD
MNRSERIKYLNEEEIRRLRQSAEDRAIVDLRKGRRTGIVEWMVLDLACLGLRASEIRNLQVGDVHIANRSFLAVRTLKRRLAVVDQLPLEGGLRDHLKEYLLWKQSAGESMNPESPLLVSNKGTGFSLRGIEHLAKRMMAAAGLDPRFSLHSLRHTTAVHLLRKTNNLRLVQKVLRHSSSSVTEQYADVMEDDLRQSLDGLYGE